MTDTAKRSDTAPERKRKMCKYHPKIIYAEDYRGYLIYENSTDNTHIYYEVRSGDDQSVEDISRYCFDTKSECKNFIDKILK
jgi:hypothetical protein